MKFSEKNFSITKDYEKLLADRRDTFMDVTDSGRGVVITFITPKGLTQGIHNSVVHSSLTASDLFADL